MGYNSGIPWTHHTFNPWWGCTKVDDGCRNCYAEKFVGQKGHDVWGVGKPRKFFKKPHWNQIFAWENLAKQGERQRVFIGSLCDVFDPEVAQYWRTKLWQYFDLTPHLDKLLVTKRPELIPEMFPGSWLTTPRTDTWIIVSVSDQKTAEQRLPIAAEIPAHIRGISYEPAIGEIDFLAIDAFAPGGKPAFQRIIFGGESIGARPAALLWARDTANLCRHLGIAFFMKQIGSYLAEEQGIIGVDSKGENPQNFPEDLRIRQFPG